jgi:hypothetical protein
VPVIPSWTSVSPSDFVSAAEAGAGIGQRSRQLSDEEAQQQAQMLLENSRLNLATQQQSAERQQQMQEAAMRAKLEAEQLQNQSQYQNGVLANNASKDQSAAAIDALKLAQPQVISTGRGGVGTFNPLNSQFTQDEPSQPYPTPAVKPTPPNPMTMVKYKSLIDQRNRLMAELPRVDPALQPQYKSQIDDLNNQIAAIENPPSPLTSGTPDQTVASFKKQYQDAIQAGNLTAAQKVTSDLKAYLAANPNGLNGGSPLDSPSPASSTAPINVDGYQVEVVQ